MAIEMSEESRKYLEKLEKNSLFPTGVGRIDHGDCPAGGHSPTSCMLCPYGHILECHYPYTCEEVEYSHYEAEMDVKWSN